MIRLLVMAAIAAAAFIAGAVWVITTEGDELLEAWRHGYKAGSADAIDNAGGA